MFEYLVFSEGEAFQGEKEIRIEVDGSKLRYRLHDETAYRIMPDYRQNEEGFYFGDAEFFIRRLESFDVPHWEGKYYIPACDGYWWNLRYKEVGKPCRKITGSNDCPDCFYEFVDHVFSVVREDIGMLDYLRYTESENGVLFRKYEARIRDWKLNYKFTGPYFSDNELGEHVFDGDVYDFLMRLDLTGFRKWDGNYTDVPMLDGIDWILEYKYTEENSVMISGSNKGPKNIQEFVFALDPDNIRAGHVEI